MFSTAKFGDVYAEPSRNGLNRPRSVRGEGFKMVNMGELFAYDRIAEQEMDRVQMNVVEQEKYCLKAGDLLFARQSIVAAGTGKCSIILTLPEPTTFESHLIRVRLNTDNSEPFYYYYYFNSPQGKNNVQSLVIQVSAAGIRASELPNLLVPNPPLTTQRKIAAILSAYDDLIENNLKRIKILEKISQNLYREWFVNFHFPGYENVKMVDSKFGTIPEGCVIQYLGDLIQIKKGKKAEPVLSETDIPVSYILIETMRGGESQVVSNHHMTIAEETDVIMVMDGASSGMVGIGMKGAVGSTLAAISSFNQETFSNYLLYCMLRDKFTEISSKNVGAAIPHANKDYIKKIPIILPAKEINTFFHENCQSAFRQIMNANNRNVILRKTRDLLLPKLISGEIDVSDLDIKVREPS